MINHRKTLAGLAAAVGLVALAPATQAAVIATLTFDTPTGTVASNASIPVYLTLTLDPSSDPLSTDASGFVTSPLSAQNLIDLGGHSVGVVVNVAFQCGDTFTNCFSGSPYTFNFNYGAPSFIGAQNLNLAAGSTSPWLFGTFDPAGGNAPAGTYEFYNALFNFQYYDAATNQHFSSEIAHTCTNGDKSCAFTRTVYAVAGVPEPATWGMMLLGFGLIGAALRSPHRRISAV